MPFREQEVHEICSHPECDAWADNACLRCAQPLCAKHTPSSDRRCDRCEREWDSLVLANKPALAQRRARRFSTWLLPGLLGVVLTGAVFVSPYGVFMLVGVGTVIAFYALVGENPADVETIHGQEVRKLKKARRDETRRRLLAWDALRCGFLAERKHGELMSGSADNSD